MENSLESLRQPDRHSGECIRLYPNRQSEDYPSHWHTSFELIHPVENGYTVQVAEKVYRLQQGDILLIPSGIVHSITAPETGLRYIFMLERDEMVRMLGSAGAVSSLYPCAHLTPGRNAALHRECSLLLFQAAQEHQGSGYFRMEMVRALLMRLMILLCRSLLLAEENAAVETELNKAPAGRDKMAIFLDVCSYILQHCHQKLTLEETARYAGYSRNHFAKMFRELSGKSFSEYCLEQRMQLCEQLLADSSVPVTEAAMRAGFGSLATFNRIFREKKGMTPTQYRRMLKDDLYHR